MREPFRAQLEAKAAHKSGSTLAVSLQKVKLQSKKRQGDCRSWDATAIRLMPILVSEIIIGALLKHADSN